MKKILLLLSLLTSLFSCKKTENNDFKARVLSKIDKVNKYQFAYDCKGEDFATDKGNVHNSFYFYTNTYFNIGDMPLVSKGDSISNHH